MKQPCLTSLRNDKWVSILLTLIFLANIPAVAADPVAIQNPAATTAPPTSPTISEPQQQPQQESDRKSGAGAAQAAAIAGAAMAGLGCIMGLDAARKATDPKERQQLMMMAMQQCAQAAQSAAAAGKNDDAKKAVSQADVPKQPTLSQPQQVQPAKSSDEKFDLASNTEATPEELPNVDDLVTSDPITTPDLGISTGDASADTGGKIALNAESISALKPIEQAQLKYDETSKGGGSTPQPASGPTTLSFAGTRGISSEDLKNLTAEVEGTGGKTKKKGGTGSGSVDSVAGGGGDSSTASREEGGNSAFDAMLAQLMGGPAQTEAGVTGFGGLDVVVLPKETKSGKGPNIFEYATYRYRVSTYNDGRLRVRPTKQAATPKSATLAKID